MFRKVELNGRQVEVLILHQPSPALRKTLSQIGERPFVVIPDDGEIAPAIAAVGRAYAIYAEFTAKARARVLADGNKAAERAELLARFLEALKQSAEPVAQLCVLDHVRQGLKVLAELPDILRPQMELRRRRRPAPARKEDAAA